MEPHIKERMKNSFDLAGRRRVSSSDFKNSLIFTKRTLQLIV